MSKNVKLLKGDPKKAIRKLSIPLTISGIAVMLYNLIDGIWVSGLGAPQLAAVGLFMPFMIVITSLANGIGIGASSAIARAIGKNYRKLASNVAEHSMIIGVIIGSAFGYSIYPFLNKIFIAMKATGTVSELASAYGHMILIASPIAFISLIGNMVLVGEGDAKRPMYITLAGSITNIILDPIFIYKLNYGIVGAAFATVLSLTLVGSVIIFWLIYQRKTYVQLKFKYFKFKTKILKEIFKVGIPSSITQILAAISMAILSAIVLLFGGTNGMAIFSAGWRIVMLLSVPISSIGMAGVSVFGSAFGERNIKKLKEGYFYAIKYASLIGIGVGIATFVFAPQLSYLFTYSKNSQNLANGITIMMKYLSIYFPILSLTVITSGLFRGMGWGMHSLAVTSIRSVIFQPLIAYLLATEFKIPGIWIGIDIAVILSGIISIAWANIHLKVPNLSNT